MDNGWQTSAQAWIADMGEHGDFGRRYVLDRVMLPRALARLPRTVLDVGCGEGRFSRMLEQQGVHVAGIDPTPALIRRAKSRDASGTYIQAIAEGLPFADATFDLVVSYLSLIDIPDIDTAIGEMARVLRPGGTLLIANLNGFNTANIEQGWVTDQNGDQQYYAVDRYLEPRAIWCEWRGIRIVNYHRPQSAYFRALLSRGLILTYFDEPAPSEDAPAPKAESYRRVPWYHVMEWLKPGR